MRPSDSADLNNLVIAVGRGARLLGDAAAKGKAISGLNSGWLAHCRWARMAIQTRFSARLRGHARIWQGRRVLACSMIVGRSAIYLGFSWIRP